MGHERRYGFIMWKPRSNARLRTLYAFFTVLHRYRLFGLSQSNPAVSLIPDIIPLILG